MDRDSDLKHAMLYSELDATNNGIISQAQQLTAQASIGLPTSAHHQPPPPSYDEAVISPYVSQLARQPSITQTNSSVQPSAPELILATPITPKTTQSYGATDAINRTSFVNSMMQDQNTQQQHLNPHQYQHNQSQSQQPVMPITVQPTGARGTHAELPNLGPHPCKVTCPACGQARTTRVNYTPNIRTHVSAMILCLVGWCCCACIVPYCMNSCRTGNHYCAKCNTFLGAYTNTKRRF